MLSYCVIYSKNRALKCTFLQTICCFSKGYLERIFLDYDNCILPLAEFQAKIPWICLCHDRSMNARCFTCLWNRHKWYLLDFYCMYWMYFISPFIICSKICWLGYCRPHCADCHTSVRARSSRPRAGAWEAVELHHSQEREMLPVVAACCTFLAAAVQRYLWVWVTSLWLLLPGPAKDLHTERQGVFLVLFSADLFWLA